MKVSQAGYELIHPATSSNTSFARFAAIAGTSFIKAIWIVPNTYFDQLPTIDFHESTHNKIDRVEPLKLIAQDSTLQTEAPSVGLCFSPDVSILPYRMAKHFRPGRPLPYQHT